MKRFGVLVTALCLSLGMAFAQEEEPRRIRPIDDEGGGTPVVQSALELHIFNVASGQEVFAGDDIPLHVPIVMAVVGAWNQHDPKLITISQNNKPVESWQLYADAVGILGNVRVVAVFAEHMWTGGSTTQHGHDYIALTEAGPVTFDLYGAWNEDLSDFGFVESITFNAVDTWNIVEAWASQWPYALSSDGTFD